MIALASRACRSLVHLVARTARPIIRALTRPQNLGAFRQGHLGPRYPRPNPPPALLVGGATVQVYIVGVKAKVPNVLAKWDEVVHVDEGAFSRIKLQSGRHLVILLPSVTAEATARVVRRCHLLYVPILVFIAGDEFGVEANHISIEQLLAWADAVVTHNANLALSVRCRKKVDRIVIDGGNLTPLHDWLALYRSRVLPKITMVAVVCRELKELPNVLCSYFAQTYPGDIELIFVNDSGGQACAGWLERASRKARQWRRGGRVREYRLLVNEQPRGRGESRNRGIRQATGDIVIVADADRELHPTVVERHAQAHSFGDCDVAIGPTIPNRDEVNQASFLNLTSLNFSIRRSFIQEDLWDPQFTPPGQAPLSSWPGDVEMGYRLYQRGARIQCVPGGSSPPSSGKVYASERIDEEQALGPLAILLGKHPQMCLEVRRWLSSKCSSYLEDRRDNYTESASAREVSNTLASNGAAAQRIAVHSAKRTLRVLTYRWHVPHQYELYKLGHEFHLINDLESPVTRSWAYGERPLPPNASLRSKRGIRFEEYDLAILHFDENVLSHENTNGVLGREWGGAFRWFVETVNIPKVAICHGTPQFHGQYNLNYSAPDLMQVIEPAREKLVDYLGNIPVVCNSYQAAREWGFRRSQVIWHGFDPSEFPPATYERGILSALGPNTVSRPHYRGYFLHRQVFQDFPEEHAPHTLWVPEPSPIFTGNQYAVRKYRNYVDQIRSYSVYFNPTLRSPMPRARGEPMMCGVVTVNANNHDVHMFIRNGVNGFYSNDPGELRDYLLFLCRNPATARRIGSEGRRTALDIFNHDRYLSEWENLIRAVV